MLQFSLKCIVLVLCISSCAQAQKKDLPLVHQQLSPELFKKYEDSLVFTLPQYPPLSADGPAIKPSRYTLQLPSKLRDYYEDMPTYMLFNYKNGENLIVRTNHSQSANQEDSSFVPDVNYLDHFLPMIDYIDEQADFMPQKGRETKVIVKGNHEILLLNIKPENIAKFTESAKSLRILSAE